MAETAQPRVSVGLPVYNGEDFVREAIDSILGQTFRDFELIISDNGSTDATESICRDYAARDPRVRYERNDINRGAAWNFNNVFDLARADYFQWAAHDDVYDLCFLEQAVPVLDNRDDVVLCFAGTDFIDENGTVVRQYPFPIDVNNASTGELFALYSAKSHIVHEVFGLIRTEVLRGSPLIGGYASSDKVLLAVLALRGRFYQLPETLFFHREHSGRSTKAAAGADNFTQWFDASKSGKVTTPFLRRNAEIAKGVFRADVSVGTKLECLRLIGRSLYRKRDQVWAEVGGALRRSVSRA